MSETPTMFDEPSGRSLNPLTLDHRLTLTGGQLACTCGTAWPADRLDEVTVHIVTENAAALTWLDVTQPTGRTVTAQNLPCICDFDGPAIDCPQHGMCASYGHPCHCHEFDTPEGPRG